MINLQEAFLALIQRFRNDYHDQVDKDLALRPITFNDSALIDQLNDLGSLDQQDVNHERDYQVATLSNAVVSSPHQFKPTKQNVWEIYREALQGRQSMEELKTTWRDAQYSLKLHENSLPQEEKHFYDTVLDDLQWEEVVLGETQLKALLLQAKQNASLLGSFEAMYGDYETKSSVKVLQVQLKKASVDIIRPWMDPDLLRSSLGSMKGRTSLRDKPSNGRMLALPTQFLLLQGLMLTVKTTASKRWEESKESGVDYFGPILLNQRRTSTTSPYSYWHGLQSYSSTARLIKQNLVYNFQQAEIRKNAQGLHYGIGTETFPNSWNYQAETGLLPTNLNDFGILAKKTDRAWWGQVREIARDLLAKVVRVLQRTFQPFLSGELRASSKSRKCQFQGRVIDEKGRGIAGVDVLVQHMIKGGIESLQKQSTDKQGNFMFELERNQSYQVVLVKSGFEQGLDTLAMGKDGIMHYIKRLKKKSTTHPPEVLSDMQLLAVVYQELDSSPDRTAKVRLSSGNKAIPMR